MKNADIENVFVLHVKKGYEDRKAHIDTHFPKRGFNNFEYILDGDIADLNESITNSLFGNTEDRKPAELSCFYKHYLVYKKMVDENIETALVFEDDAILTDDAFIKCQKALAELEGQSNYIVNLEHSNRSVPVWIKKNNQLLYPVSHTKRCGGYFIHLDVAKKIVDYFKHHTTHWPVDSFQTHMRTELKYNIYWMDPPIVFQGSKNGKFHSELSNRKKSSLGGITSLARDFYQRYILTNISKKRMKSFKDIEHFK